MNTKGKSKRANSFLALLTAVSLLPSTYMFMACTEEQEQDLISEKQMLEITVCDETQDAATRASYNGLTTTFEEGDAIGIYAVDGNSAVYSNIKYTLTNGQWVATQKCPYNGQYVYYAYYPYTETPETPSFSASGDENSQFSTMINNWSVSSDQGTLEKFRANDLMIGTGTHTFGRTVSFTMKHKMALAVLDSDVATFSYAYDTDTRYDVAMTYGGMIPYFDGTSYYLFMQPDELTAIGGQQLKAGGGRYTTGNGGTVTENYSLSYSTDGGNTFSETKPSWMLDITAVNGTEKIPTNFVVTVSDEKTTDIIKRTVTETVTKEYVAEGLRKAEPVADRDLSLYKNDRTERESRTTANCYLVHNPGTYRIPLVYGNAIKNGADNTLAYHATATGDHIRQDMVRHDDQPIVSPWIKDNGITVNGAELLWQDAKGLIAEVGIDGDYLTFTVSEENITAGNAVIAAKTGETIVWSWHIWVTEEILNDLTEIDTGSHKNLLGVSAPYRVASVNVGQIPTYAAGTETKTTYAGSACIVRVTISNGTQLTFPVSQKDVTVTTTSEMPLYCCSPFYQWGRKDPMIASTENVTKSDNAKTVNHNAWDIMGVQLTSIDGNSNYSSMTSGNTIGMTIQNPVSHFSNRYGPYDEYMYNYWDINQNGGGNISTATRKTVYDPCPPDFCVPTGNLYYFMKGNTNRTQWYRSNTNARWDSENRAFVWQKDGAELMFPALGTRTRNGCSGFGAKGHYWSASAEGNTSGMDHRIDSSSWGWMNLCPKEEAISVRPVVEE